MPTSFARAALVACALIAVAPQTPAEAQPPGGRGPGGRGGGFEGRGAALPQQGEPAGAQLGVGTASVAGVVLVAGTGQPARRARVSLNALEGGGARTMTADDDGRYSFASLPAGRYTLSATKQGHIGITYGQTRPGRPGTPIQLGEGERFAATLQIPRGGVLTGTVFDEFSEPTPGTQVRAMRYVMQAGRRTLQQAGAGSTDDRGIYRIFGLQPGEYIVSAVPRNIGPMVDMARLQAEIQSARERVTSGGGDEAVAREMAARTAVLQSQLMAQQEEQASGYAPIYFPGTVSPAEAAAIALAVGEERANVDFQLQRVPMGRLDGIVVNTAGAPVQNVQLTLVDASQSVTGIGNSSTRADAQGRFRMHNIPPGHYRLTARATAGAGGRGQAAPQGGRGGRGAVQQADAVRLWGAVDVSVDGRALTNIVVPLQAGLGLSGRVVFDGTTQPPADLTRLRVTLIPADAPAAPGLTQPASAAVDAAGHFTISSVVPGTYRLTASGAGSGWMLHSTRVEGEDTLDFPFEVRAGQALTSAVITFTDRKAQLSGAITNQRGAPAPEFTLILYPADEQYWGPHSRRIRSTRPATTGSFTFADLPPGNYRLVAIVDVEPGAWFDPAFLQQIDAAGMRITIRDGEQHQQHLQVASP